MQQRYFEGVVQPLGEPAAEDASSRQPSPSRHAEVDPAASSSSRSTARSRRCWRAIDHANKYIVETAPFTLAKDPAHEPRVGAILHHLLEALLSSTASSRAVPARDGGAASSSCSTCPPDALALPARHAWGTAFPAGASRSQKPEMLFPRIED